MRNKHKIKIIIADDHEFFRNGLSSVIRENENYDLIGEASNWTELLDQIKVQLPDIVILDIVMPEKDGIQVTEILRKSYPLVKVIALTTFDEDAIIINMLKAGAYSFLDKNITKEEIYRTIDAVFQSEDFYFPPKLRKRTFQLLQDQPKQISGRLKKDFSDRELDIILLTCQDHSLKEIANQLGISPRTVESHRSRIMEKMEVKSAAGLVAFAFKNRLFMQKENI
jgi:two-component system response regulator NreC